MNGKNISYMKDESVTELLKRMRYTFPLIIVKINGKLVKKKDYKVTIIPDNADVKVVHLISGG